ncbi:MAG: NAD-dependent succinate-semialdehyde dehydrogenase, partial [Candidatus Marinimicrobia bacterium]|nr:NAD-dependent succinate-semialdehyde dehydrogenase [Candidatus Neomarinimicrobiota bacterium]
MKSINPATGKLIGEYPVYSNDETTDIISKTQATWASWKVTDFEQRSILMH